MTSARARGREFAILRSLGLTRRGMRSVLNSQATTIAAVGLLVGVPLGVILGRVRVGDGDRTRSARERAADARDRRRDPAAVRRVARGRDRVAAEPPRRATPTRSGAAHRVAALPQRRLRCRTLPAMSAAPARDDLAYFAEPAPMTAIDEQRFAGAARRSRRDAVRDGRCRARRADPPRLGADARRAVRRRSVGRPTHPAGQRRVGPSARVAGRSDHDEPARCRIAWSACAGTSRCSHVALLRRQGIPARARVGFARYFGDGWVDHWITERWDGRWVRDDAQIGFGGAQRALARPSIRPINRRVSS